MDVPEPCGLIHTVLTVTNTKSQPGARNLTALCAVGLCIYGLKWGTRACVTVWLMAQDILTQAIKPLWLMAQDILAQAIKPTPVA